MKKELSQRSNEKSEVKLELERYKDLLNLREKEIQSLKHSDANHKKSDDNWKKKVSQLEKEKKELSQMLMKAQRGVSPFKVNSRAQF